MILLVHTEPAFTELIHTRIPKLARIPMIRDAMKKFTSGYLTEERLTKAVKAGTLPMVRLTDAKPPHPNHPQEKRLENLNAGGSVRGSDTITIDGYRFTSYKKRELRSLVSVPATVFHELAHWGYDFGQRNGHPSDESGRAHQNHNGYRSPLDDEVEKALRIVAAMHW